jgi:hypothetical protein
LAEDPFPVAISGEEGGAGVLNSLATKETHFSTDKGHFSSFYFLDRRALVSKTARFGQGCRIGWGRGVLI